MNTKNNFLRILSNDEYVNSGDEIDYVITEKTYYINTEKQRGILVLPHNPKDKFKIIVSDYFGSWLYYPLIIHRNGNKIMGIEENMTCDIPYSFFSMTYLQKHPWGWIIQ
jgi:hypothetical protein